MKTIKTLFVVAGLLCLTIMTLAQKVDGRLENITSKTATIVLTVNTIGKGYNYNSVYANVGYYGLEYKFLRMQSVFLDNLSPDLDIYRKKITLSLLEPSVKFVKFVSVSRKALGDKDDSASNPNPEQEVESDYLPFVDRMSVVRGTIDIESPKETRRGAVQNIKSINVTEPKNSSDGTQKPASTSVNNPNTPSDGTQKPASASVTTPKSNPPVSSTQNKKSGEKTSKKQSKKTNKKLNKSK